MGRDKQTNKDRGCAKIAPSNCQKKNSSCFLWLLTFSKLSSEDRRKPLNVKLDPQHFICATESDEWGVAVAGGGWLGLYLNHTDPLFTLRTG